MPNILILILGHLCNAPRSQKEAETLANAGYDVTIGGIWFDPKFVDRDCHIIADKPYKFVQIVDFQPSHRLTNFWIRFQNRLAKEIYHRWGILSPNLLGYGVSSMLKFARKAKADLTIVHSESGLWIGNKLLDEGFKIGVDFEDWFSEDLLPEARIHRPIGQLKQLEQRLIQSCKYCLTTSQAMAEAMANTYQAPPPTVIYNSFPWSEREHIDGKIKDRKNLNIPSIHWFSQTIGAGRGLETLFQALKLVNFSAEIHLRGNYPDSARQWLEPLIPEEWRDRVFIHPTVSNYELLSRISEHDIGLALEYGDIPSRNYTVTNKLFQYLQAGLAIIATDTAGQKEVLSCNPEVGHLIPSNSPLALAEAIESLFLTPTTLELAKLKSLQLAKEFFCWELETEKIVWLVNKALNETK